MNLEIPKKKEIKQREKYHVAMLSGGKDSSAMVLEMIRLNMKLDEIICIDTTKEFPEMYEHIKKLELYINKAGVKFTKIKISFDYYMFDHIKTKGKNKGKKGYSWPDFNNRWCTALKRQSAKKHLKQIRKKYTVIEYHGIASDEPKRFDKNKDSRIIKMPLVEWDMTEKDCLKYCYNRGYYWGSLYEKIHRVSCYLCPLSRIAELEIVYINYPKLWEEMKQKDLNTYRKFRNDYSILELEYKFNNQKQQEKTK